MLAKEERHLPPASLYGNALRMSIHRCLDQYNSLHQSTVSGLAGLCLGARCRSRCRPSATISSRMTCQHSLIVLSWPRIAYPIVIDVLSRILSLVPFCLVPEFRVSSFLTRSPYCPFFPPTYTTAPFPTFFNFIIIYFPFPCALGYRNLCSTSH